MAIVLPICSSSKGNCTYVGSSGSGILVDVGCSFKAVCDGLKLNGLAIENVRAVFITHEHIDHINGLFQLTKRMAIPIFTSTSVAEYLIKHEKIFPTTKIHTLDCDEIDVDDFFVRSFQTSHDSVGSQGYRIDFADRQIGVCTDLGVVTPTVKRHLIGCELVLLESNYEPEILRHNPKYPPYLKERISGDNGHLSNADSAQFACELIEGGTTRLILGHLSQENNTPKTAFSAHEKALSLCGAKCGIDYLLEVAPVKTNGEMVIV